MKSVVILLAGLCVGIAAGVIYFKMQKPAPAPMPVVESAPAPAVSAPEPAVAINKPVVAPEPASAPSPATNAVASNPETEAAAALRKTIDALLSPQITPREKHALFEQLRQSGQLDQAIAELKRRATDDPTNAQIPTTLGEALLNKVSAIHAAGGDVNEMGILAMQADQSFNAALKLDPANWEAQYVKYSTMVYWPANEARDNEAAQKLSSLIDQQEALPQQAHFAQTYVALGNQYQKMGKTDFAEATWRLGLTKFPNDPTLLKKLTP
jgi:tetratricopeptide (TPR) repeat protein